MSVSKLLRPHGGLQKLMNMPCVIPWTVAGVLAAESIAKAIFAFEEPDLKHLYHMTGGQTFNHSVHSVIQEGIEADQTFLGGLGRFVAKFNALADVAAWQLFIAGLGQDALINFISAAHRQPECLPPGSTHHGSAAEAFLAVPIEEIGPAFEWFGNGILDPAGYPRWLSSPGGVVSNTMVSGCHDGLGNPLSLLLFITNDDTGEVLDFDTTTYTDTGVPKPTITFNHFANASSSYQQVTVYGMAGGGKPGDPGYPIDPYYAVTAF